MQKLSNSSTITEAQLTIKEAMVSSKFDFSYNPLSKETISSMTEDDLSLSMRRFKRLIKEAKNSGKDATPYEVEYCYLDHELQMRRCYGHSSKR